MKLYHGRDADDTFEAMVGTCLTDSKEAAEAYARLASGSGNVYTQLSGWPARSR